MKEVFKLQLGNFELSSQDFPSNLIGKIMLDIAFCQVEHCRDKQTFLELLEHTAKTIIERLEAVNE